MITEKYEFWGTSYASPQVAVAAYLASRLKYTLKPWDPLDMQSFMACIQNSCERDPDAESLTQSQQLVWEKVNEPSENLNNAVDIFYSYRVGYGSLDVHDMLEYILNLS